jgi:putative FmdB family regulatory protein
MPLFEYSCRKCSRRFERLVFGAETPECPSCGSPDLEKLLSAFAVGGGSDASGEFAGDAGGGCGSCGDPRGPGSCAIN